MNYKSLRIEEADDVLTVTLHRPERRNALNPELMEELLHVFEIAGKRPSGVLVLTGSGDAFCAGLDLDRLSATRDHSPAQHQEEAERTAQMFRTLYELPIPTIAAVNGAAIAGGTGLATLCDFTLAVPQAKFGYTEVRIGFIPAVVSSFLILQLGVKQARDLLLSGRTFSAEEAKQMSLVNEIVDPIALLPRAQQLAQSLLQNSPEAVRATKRLLADLQRARLDHELQLSMAASIAARSTDDFREGVAAFLEKRKPDWPSRKKMYLLKNN